MSPWSHIERSWSGPPRRIYRSGNTRYNPSTERGQRGGGSSCGNESFSCKQANCGITYNSTSSRNTSPLIVFNTKKSGLRLSRPIKYHA
ncbi:hypothetical protein AVEN_52617-1 [Araneus ventricosus]|uniref:Uncharacterized protein n=1 Tax=Araneus ventricosus TaxID=182803 RepID=A0A4Y2ESE3_ARAVE|nr:hypothetical protein AVEN_52617-1 [Araneus ventricosus]